MARYFLILIILSLTLQKENLFSQKADIDSLFRSFITYYNANDWINAESELLKIVNNHTPEQKRSLYSIYNNLGVINSRLGKFTDAVMYYDSTEVLIEENERYSAELPALYSNKGSALTNLKQFDPGRKYLEKAIRLFTSQKAPSKSSLRALSAAYLNYGILLLETGDPQAALKNLKLSYRIKAENNFSGIPLVYFHEAKAYQDLNDTVLAEKYFRKGIENFIKESGESYYQLADLYFNYADFLQKCGRTDESLDILYKALKISKSNYGYKHTIISMAYKLLGDHFMDLSQTDSALVNYQKSLIAIVPGYNNRDFMDNPVIDSALFDNRCLENLKKKSLALELLSESSTLKSEKIKFLNKSIETSSLALDLIDRIRKGYSTEEDRLYLTDNEKATYSDAIQQIYELYTITLQPDLITDIYNVARKAKAAVLLDEITGNEAFIKSQLPDSLTSKVKNLSAMISAYEKFILEESDKIKPDTARISLWNDGIFKMNRDLRITMNNINSRFPAFMNLHSKTDPEKLSDIQKKLKANESIVEFYCDNIITNNKRNILIFVTTKNDLHLFKTEADSIFSENISTLRKLSGNPQLKAASTGESKKSLYYFYNLLIEPIENYFAGNRLIIIPDEEITWIPFDALLSNPPKDSSQSFDGLDFLLYRYTISYGYSSSLVKKELKQKWTNEIISFAPDYSTVSNEISDLEGAAKEIQNILKYFKGEMYNKGRATKENFNAVLGKSVPLHLAMHSVLDSSNSKYSYLLFEGVSEKAEDTRLFNYEISLLNINSPMVVLSTCNSGSGKLYHGEGLMSMARGFTIAGASSVIKTGWEVNDEVSSEIITGFYKNLAHGKAKDVAMRNAKIEFLEENSPMLHNPYYWAAYEVVGDNSPLKKSLTSRLITGIVILSGIIIIVINYRRWRKIFFDGN